MHSTTKYMDGHAVQGGGVIVDSGKFDWANGNVRKLAVRCGGWMEHAGADIGNMDNIGGKL